MPFIISAGTFIDGFGSTGGLGTQIGIGDRGIQSINISTNVTPNRLWHLGYSTPYDENVTVQKQLSIACYGGSTETYAVAASTDCSEPDPFNITITANDCSGGVFNDVTAWFLNSYSYAKDMQGWGIETWSFISKPILLDANLEEVTDVTTLMIRGIPEGEKSIDGGADPGIVFVGRVLDETSILALNFVGNASVRAENPGIGRANDMQYGVVESVGNSTGKADGKDGNGSVNIPHTPLYTS